MLVTRVALRVRRSINLRIDPTDYSGGLRLGFGAFSSLRAESAFGMNLGAGDQIDRQLHG
jgi:hypothetical protein